MTNPTDILPLSLLEGDEENPQATTRCQNCEGRGRATCDTVVGLRRMPCPHCRPGAFAAASVRLVGDRVDSEPSTVDTTPCTIDLIPRLVDERGETITPSAPRMPDRMAAVLRSLLDISQSDAWNGSMRLDDALTDARDALDAYERVPPAPDTACRPQLDPLTRAITFISGFADDDLQIGVPEMLAGLRALQAERVVAAINATKARGKKRSVPAGVADVAEPALVVDKVQLRRDFGRSAVRITYHHAGKDVAHVYDHHVPAQSATKHLDAAESLDNDVLTLRDRLSGASTQLALVIAAAQWLRQY